MTARFEERLTGGHPNSLGNTIEVVDEVLASKAKLRELVDCYKSSDEVVRLRVSNGVKRVSKEHPDWVMEYIDELQSWVSEIDQPSTHWTLSWLFEHLHAHMSEAQRLRAVEIMKHNLTHDDDWIVQNNTLAALAHYAKGDKELTEWLIPELKKSTKSKHKSVARRAEKLLVVLA